MTKEQENSINFYIRNGYIWNKTLSAQLAAVAISKGDSIHVYGLDGSISLNFDLNSSLKIEV